MPYRLRDGSSVEDPRLDRLVQFDERSRSFPVREVAGKPRSYTWSVGGVYLDQGREGACVGFAWTHEAAARPKVRAVTEADAFTVYRRAQTIDEWPGEAYSGTSVLAGAKASVERGWFTAYRWAFGLDDLVRGVGSTGPAVLGLNWYEGMFDTDLDGYLHPTGDLLGGHAIVCHSVSLRLRRFTLHNSWGKTWGRDGTAYVSFEAMERLLHEDGEACFPLNRR